MEQDSKEEMNLKYSKKRIAVIVVLVTVIVVVQLHIFGYSIGKFSLFSWWEKRAEFQEYDQNAKVLDWAIKAVPILSVREPAVVDPTNNFGRRSVMSTRRRETGPKVPAVQVEIEIQLEHGEKPAWIWPNARELQFLRSNSRNGTYEVIESRDRSNLLFLSKRATAPQYGRPSRTAPRLRRIRFVDWDVGQGTSWYYKARFLGTRNKILGETGFCSCPIVPIPSPSMEMSADGFPKIKWPAVRLDNSLFSVRPRLIVGIGQASMNTRLNQVHQLGRFPVAGGSFKLPVKMTTTIGTLQNRDLVFGVSCAARMDEWRMTSGQASAERAIWLTTSVCAADGNPLPTNQRHYKNATPAVFVQPADSRYTGFYGSKQDGYFVKCFLPRSEVTGSRSLRTISIRVNSPALGERKYHQAQFDYSGFYHGPGLSQRQHYELSWSPPTAKESGSAHISAVRNPLPTGLVASPADGCVKLRWDELSWNEEDWVDGPWFVIRRCDESKADLEAKKTSIVPDVVICRLKADTTEYLDRNVRNGRAYFYMLGVQGVSRATSWSEDVGEYACYLPVDVKGRMGFSGCPTMATPGPEGPLRMAVMSSETTNSHVRSAESILIRSLGNVSWIELVERATAHALLDEQQIGELGPTETQDQSDFQEAMAADLVIRCSDRNGHRGAAYLDVWMEDFRNSRRERILTVPVADLDLIEIPKRTLEEISRRFPRFQTKLREEQARADSIPRTIAILGLVPLAARSSTSIARGSVEDLLTAALSDQKGLDIVERERVDAVIKELGLGGVVDQEASLRIGAILKADALLTGFCSISNEKIGLSLRLVDVETGSIKAIIEETGDLTDLPSLGQRLGRQIRGATTGAAAAADHPLLRWLDAKLSRTGKGRIKEAKRALYVSPEDPNNHKELATAYEQAGKHREAIECLDNAIVTGKEKGLPWNFDVLKSSAFRSWARKCEKAGAFDEALRHYDQALLVTDSEGNRWFIYLSESNLLQNLDRNADEVALWKRATLDYAEDKEHRSESYLNLGIALLRSGKNDQARQVLDKVKIPRYELGRLCEELGMYHEAIKAYQRTVWENMRIGYGRGYQQDRLPRRSYAALIRLLHDPKLSKFRAEVLEAMAKALTRDHPYQTLRAADECLQLGATNSGMLLAAAESLMELGRELEAERYLLPLIKGSPHTLECMEALIKLSIYKRRLGRHEEADELLRSVGDHKVKGQRADVLRGIAKHGLSMTSHSVRKPTTRPKVQPLKDADLKRLLSRNCGLKSGTKSYLRTRGGLVACVDSRSKVLLWWYDLRQLRPWPVSPHGGGFHDITLRSFSQAMVISGDLLLVSDFLNGILHALDKETGRERWRSLAWAPISSPMVLGDKVYIATSAGDLTELSLQNGALLRRTTHTAAWEGGSSCAIPVLRLSRNKDAVELVEADEPWREAGTYMGSYRGRSSAAVDLASFRTEILQRRERQQVAEPADDLLKILLDRSSGHDKPKGTRIILAIGGPEKAVSWLIELLRDREEDPVTRHGALSVLSKICPKAILPYLPELLDDESKIIKRRIVYLLGEIGDRSHSSRVATLLDDSDIQIQSLAAGTLVKLAGAAAGPLLIDRLEGSRWHTRWQVAFALAEAGYRDIIPILKNMRKKDRYDRGNLLLALCLLGDESAIDELESRIKMPTAAEIAGQGATSYRRRSSRVQQTLQMIAANMARLPQDRLIPAVILASRGYADAGMKRDALKVIGKATEQCAIPFLIENLPEYGARSPWQLAGADKAALPALEKLTGQAFGLDRGRWELWWHTTADEELRKEGRRLLDDYKKREALADTKDTDGDGMPDYWEMKHGLDPNDATGKNGSGGDLDGDGTDNLAEMRSGTQPNDAGSGVAR